MNRPAALAVKTSMNGEVHEASLVERFESRTSWYDVTASNAVIRVAPGAVSPDDLQSGVWVGDDFIRSFETREITVLFDDGEAIEFTDWRANATGAGGSASDGGLRAPMPG